MNVNKVMGTAFTSSGKLMPINRGSFRYLVRHPHHNSPRKAKAIHHFTVKELKKYGLLKKKLGSFFKFAIVRNPYDRFISEYFWSPLAKNMEIKQFARFIEEIVKNESYDDNLYYDHFRPQADYFEGIKYNFVGRFERFNEDMRTIARKLNIRVSEIPHSNKSKNKQRKHYREYYDDELKEIITRIYQKDINRFDYEF